MIDSKLIPDTDHMEVGYDFQEVNTRMKWYSDKFIIGAMDEYQKILLGNTLKIPQYYSVSIGGYFLVVSINFLCLLL